MRDLIAQELETWKQRRQGIQDQLDLLERQRAELFARFNEASGAIKALETVLGASQEEYVMTEDELMEAIGRAEETS